MALLYISIARNDLFTSSPIFSSPPSSSLLLSLRRPAGVFGWDVGRVDQSQGSGDGSTWSLWRQRLWSNLWNVWRLKVRRVFYYFNYLNFKLSWHGTPHVWINFKKAFLPVFSLSEKPCCCPFCHLCWRARPFNDGVSTYITHPCVSLFLFSSLYKVWLHFIKRLQYCNGLVGVCRIQCNARRRQLGEDRAPDVYRGSDSSIHSCKCNLCKVEIGF